MADFPVPEPIVYTSKPLELTQDARELGYSRADLEFHEMDHSGWSYRGSLFINNPKASVQTPRTLDNGYVGYFTIFGHGGCYGDEGHCEVPVTRRPFDYRRVHALTPTMKRVAVTGGLKKLLPSGGHFTVTIVAEVQGGTAQCDPKENFLRFEKIRLVTYRP